MDQPPGAAEAGGFRKQQRRRRVARGQAETPHASRRRQDAATRRQRARSAVRAGSICNAAGSISDREMAWPASRDRLRFGAAAGVWREREGSGPGHRRTRHSRVKHA